MRIIIENRDYVKITNIVEGPQFFSILYFACSTHTQSYKILKEKKLN